jgi:hypothetical protein
MPPDQVARLVPKDILIFNWFWEGRRAQTHEARLEQMGFKQIFGNFVPGIQDYDRRRQRPSLIGAAPSAWFATSETGFGKDLLPDFLACSTLLWNQRVLDGKELSGFVQARLPSIRNAFRGAPPPSQTETTLVPIDLRASFNTTGHEPSVNLDLESMATGSLRLGPVPFDLAVAGDKNAVILKAITAVSRRE